MQQVSSVPQSCPTLCDPMKHSMPSFPVHGCDSWTIKKAECQRIDAFELWCWRRLLRIPWIASRSNQSILEEINPEYSLEGEAPIFWPPDVKSWLTEKDSDAGKDWGQEEKGVTEDEMVGWHHWLNEHEFEQTLGVSEGRGSLACCSPRGHKESDTTEQLNNNNNPVLTKVNDQLENAFIVVPSLSHVWLSQTQMTTHQNILLFLSNYESQVCESVSMLLLPGSLPWMSYPGLKDSFLESSGISIVAFITVYHI